MESRLPKPKFNLLEVSNQETSNLPTLKETGKSKSGEDISTKNTKENKPPVKKAMGRSRTLAAISRPNVPAVSKVAAASKSQATTRSQVASKMTAVTKFTAATAAVSTTMPVKVAVKRPGAASTTVIAAKRPTIRAPVKASTTSSVNTRLASAKSSKATTSTSVAAKPLSKVSKWDWKTKFEIVNNELMTLKEKQKEIIDRRDELQTMVDEYKDNENANVMKITNLESENKALTDEVSGMRAEMESLRTINEKINKELNELQVSYKKASEALKEYQGICNKQRDQLSKHAEKVSALESTVANQSNTILASNGRVKDLENLCHDMDKDRRALHNTIQEMKGNIRVFCRVRPRIPKESNKNLCAITYMDESTLEIGRADGSDSMSCSGKIRNGKQEFAFDKVFSPNATQADIFEELALLVQSALEGYNVCVFAYGQTGSGKTFTMEGGPSTELEGMIPRTVRHIFTQMKDFELLGWEYKIEASFLEIYNEHIVDLLDFSQKTHEIRMVDSKGTDLYVTNLQVEEIDSPETLHECLKIAQQNRAVAATKSNERSSRSHSVARIRLIGTHKDKNEISIGNLNLVDLAGSERLKGEEAARTTETKNINKSLANLGNVILALLKKQEHIPYRNSKLTHLLMPSLGGNSKTLMLLNVSPLDDCYNETVNSLRFASTVNSCKLGNVKRSKTMIQNNSNY